MRIERSNLVAKIGVLRKFCVARFPPGYHEGRVCKSQRTQNQRICIRVSWGKLKLSNGIRLSHGIGNWVSDTRSWCDEITLAKCLLPRNEKICSSSTNATACEIVAFSATILTVHQTPKRWTAKTTLRTNNPNLTMSWNHYGAQFIRLVCERPKISTPSVRSRSRCIRSPKSGGWENWTPESRFGGR